MTSYLEDRVRELESIVRNLAGNMRNISSRGTLVEDADDKKVQKQKIKGQYGEEIDNAQRWETFGLTSRAPAGSDVLTLSMNGSRDETVILSATNPDLRPTGGGAGSTTLYDAGGTTVVLDGGGNIVITCSGNLNIKADGNVAIESASLTHNGKNVGSDHKHVSAPPGPPGIPL